MLPAPTVDDIEGHRATYPHTLCAILFAPPFSAVGRDGVIPRLGYLDQRSGKAIHFYCAGYMGYAHKKDFPDMVEIGTMTYRDSTEIPWSFSQREYARFVGDFERRTTWRSSGEADLIVLGPKVDYDDCLTFDFGRMVADGAILGSSELFEALIRYAEAHPAGTPSSFSDRKLPGLLGAAIAEALPGYLGNALKAGRHYAVRSIAR